MSDLDLPLLPSADQIRRRKFATVRRGYDPDQVDDYLKQVAEQVEALETDLRDERLATARQAPAAQTSTEQAPVAMTPGPAVSMEDENAAYDRISKRFATVLRAADEEAQKLIEQARAEADRIRVDAQANAEQARTASEAELRRAREESDRVLGGLEQRRESLLGQMHEMQSRLLAVAQNLEIPDGEPGAGAHTAVSPRTAEADASATTEQATPPTEATPSDQATPEPEPMKEPAPVPVGQAAKESETVDPRYEDMWASTGSRSVDIPDLSSLDVDFDDEKE